MVPSGSPRDVSFGATVLCNVESVRCLLSQEFSGLWVGRQCLESPPETEVILPDWYLLLGF